MCNTISSCDREQIWIDADPRWKLHSGLCETCWATAFAESEQEDVSSEHGGSMSEAGALRSPRHQHKRRRLSRLLDRLTVQIRNNNHYSTPRWLMFGAPHDEQAKKQDDAPLDLSKKPKPKAHAAKEKDAFSCSACGQNFASHDRLAKHIASRHRNPTAETKRQYECATCLRRFARSDMLTRHARLHSGAKPYTCLVCMQVFSRSDHLATHQRTHTGEKPYRCPSCPYAACRRDMITRHMRTHNRKDVA